MDRLTKSTIRGAYEATGMYPVTGTFQDGHGGGCGMRTFAVARGMDLNTFIADLKMLFGKAYFEGFTSGWDSDKPLEASDEYSLLTRYGPAGFMRYLDGREDGRAGRGEANTLVEQREFVTA